MSDRRVVSWRRVFLGGLVAGSIMNAVEWVFHYLVAGPDWWLFQAVLDDPIGRSPDYLGYTSMYLLKGIGAIWLYAVMCRTAAGTGATTAIRAAVAFWVLSYLMPVVSFEALMIESYASQMLKIPGLVALGEVVAGTLAGSRLYVKPETRHVGWDAVSQLAVAALAVFVLWVSVTR